LVPRVRCRTVPLVDARDVRASTSNFFASTFQRKRIIAAHEDPVAGTYRPTDGPAVSVEARTGDRNYGNRVSSFLTCV